MNPTTEEDIDKAVEDLRKALLENLAASKGIEEASKRKTAAHYNLIKSQERLHNLDL